MVFLKIQIPKQKLWRQALHPVKTLPHSPELPAQRRVLHVLQVLLLPPAHGAEVEGAAAVEAGQRGQVGTVEGVLCKHSGDTAR